eukprot:XP_016657796.1 PREDICTED: uncharacterized protein LOC107883013 [Acyrthosiphon pisum]
MEYKSGEFSTPSAVKQRQTKKRWVIATFPDSNNFSVIPTNWVLKTVDGSGNILVKCVWPPSTLQVTSDVLKEGLEPTDNWGTYRIKLHENGKEYSDFGKAWHTHVTLSDQSASEVEQQIINKTKNKRMWGQSSVSQIVANSDTSSDEDINILPHSKIVKSSQTAVLSEQNIVETIGDTNSGPQYCQLNNINCIPSSSRANELMNMPEPRRFNMPESSSSTLPQQIEIDQIHSVNSMDHFNRIQSEDIQTAKQNTIIELLSSIYKEQIQSRIKHDHLLSKLEQVEKAVNKIGVINNISTAMPDFDSTFMANWPMKNEQMFLNVSKCLLEDSFVSLVENWFMSIGGNSVKDNLKRVLVNIFSNEFAIHCSWTGRGKDVTTKLCDSKIVIVLKRCIKNQKEYSDALFESCLADWFRYATTRHKRSLD